MIINFSSESEYFIVSRDLQVFVGRCPIAVKRSELLSVFSNNDVFIDGNSVKIVGVESQALHDDVEFLIGI